MSIKDLIDTDGENRAVRAFLLGREVGCKDYEQMRRHMTNSGFDNCWPAEFATLGGHMSKAAQQMWLRHLFALERFGAGGGEPSRDMPHGWVTNWPAPNGGTRPVYHASAIKPKYGPELDNSLVSYPVFTRPGPSPTDLRAEYLRGLDDAANLADKVSSRCLHPDEIGEAIRALRGTQ